MATFEGKLISLLTHLCITSLILFCSVTDQANYKNGITKQLEGCRRIQEVWCELQGENVKNRCNSFKSKAEVKLFPCISDTFAYLKKKTGDEAREFHILVTGSLHLVGTVLSVLDPDLTLADCQLSECIGI